MRDYRSESNESKHHDTENTSHGASSLTYSGPRNESVPEAGDKVCENSFVLVSFLIVFFLDPWLAICTIRRATIGTKKLDSSGSRLWLTHEAIVISGVR